MSETLTVPVEEQKNDPLRRGRKRATPAGEPAAKTTRAASPAPEYVTVIFIPENDRHIVVNRDIPPVGALHLSAGYDPVANKYDSLKIEPGVNQDIRSTDWDRVKDTPGARCRYGRSPVLVVIPQIERSLDDILRTYKREDALKVIEHCGDIARLQRWKSVSSSPAIVKAIEDRIEDIRYRGV